MPPPLTPGRRGRAQYQFADYHEQRKPFTPVCGAPDYDKVGFKCADDLTRC